MFTNESEFARLLLWIRFPHVATPACLAHLNLPTLEDRLNYAIVLFLDGEA